MKLRACIAALAFAASVCIFPALASAQAVPFRTITSNISGLSAAATMSSLAGQSSCTTTIAGTWQGTLQFRESNDGVHWQLVTSYPDPGSGTAATQSTAANGTWTSPLGSFTQFQLFFSAWTSGVASTITTCGSGQPPTTAAVSATIVGGTVTTVPSGGSMAIAGQGTPGAPTGGVLSVQVPSGASSVHTICDSGCTATVGWNYFVVPANATCVSAPCVVKATAGTFGGITSISTLAQPTGNCTWYDSSSLASGNVLYLETNLGSGQVVTMPLPGIAVTNGLVVQCAANPTGSGILVYYR